jgi:hypothetical protein
MYITPACIIKPEHLPHLKPLEQIDNPYYKDISKDEAAKLLGIKSFDVSLPQHWVALVVKSLGSIQFHMLSGATTRPGLKILLELPEKGKSWSRS